MQKIYFILITTLILSACAIGPDYKKPPVTTPTHFKEAKPSKNWKLAQPNDNFDRGQWWRVFNDPQLNALEDQLNASNQSIAAATANYKQALALVDEARAAYFPTVSASLSVFKQNQNGRSGSFISTTSTTASAASPSSVGTVSSNALLLNASWEPDIWGITRRTVEASAAGAQASNAQLALTRLSSQASLAQYYFELRALDTDQQLLNDTVTDYKRILNFVRNQYAAGVSQRLDVIQAQNQLDTAQAQAINNHIGRAQYEHAIAVLIGQPPATFSLNFKPLATTPPKIPLTIPSTLLERRPDIAQAERLMAQANAQIGVNIGAYYPQLTISAFGGIQNNDNNFNLLNSPNLTWGLGPQLTGTIYDGGYRAAAVAAARANYQSTLATYRQTVLSAFQDTEDNLVALQTLGSQYVVLNKAAADARLALRLTTNQYKAGTIPFSSVVTAQTNAYTAQKNAADTNGLRMSTAVALIKSLGGGWNTSLLENPK